MTYQDKKSVYFYAVDPGSFSIMQPIFDAAPGNMKCKWVAEGHTESYFDSTGTKYFDPSSALKRLKIGDVFILGSQMNTAQTAELIKSISEKNIKTIFIFDHWCNYANHFTLPSDSFVLPTLIFVMDEHVKAKLISLAIEDSIIRVVGHPGIESVVNKVKKIDDEQNIKIRESLGLMDKKILLLALEPLSVDFYKEVLQYNEYDITQIVVDTVRKNRVNDIHLFVRLHPRQPEQKFVNFLKSKDLYESVTLCPKNVTEAESLAIADMVIGMYSVFLIIALVLGKPTISLQLNMKDYNQEFDNIPYLEANKINNPSELSVSISEELYQGSGERISLPLGSVRKAWDEIGMLL